MALNNITVTSADLETLVPNITSMKFAEQVNFDDVINEKKREVFGLVKENYIGQYKTSDSLSFYSTYGTNAEIDTLLNTKAKDLPTEEYLKNIIIRLSVAEIFRQNKKFEDAQVYEALARQIPVKYYIDTSDDDVVDIDEKMTSRRVVSFHR